MSFLDSYRAAWFRRYDDEHIIPLFTYPDYPGMTERPFACEIRPGEFVRGHFYRKPDIPVRPELVYFIHGLGGGHLSYMPEINMLCSAGYEVLAVDNPGCFESDGESIRCLSEAVFAADICLKQLAVTDPRPVIIIGHSWGAYTAGLLIGSHPELKKALLLAPFVTAADFAESFFPQIDEAADTAVVLESEYHPEYARLSLCETLAETKVPTLIAASLDDPIIPVMHGQYKIRRTISNPAVTDLTVQGRQHNPTYTERGILLNTQFVADYAQKTKDGWLETLEEKQAYVSQFNFKAIMEQDEEVWAKLLAFLTD